MLHLAEQEPKRYSASGTEDRKGYLFHGAQRPGIEIYIIYLFICL